MKRIDLNSDMGELPELLADGTQEKIMTEVSSINIACGAHAGDDSTIAATLAAARGFGLAVGAHPGYPDRVNFGRKAMALSEAALADTIFLQLHHLGQLANAAHVELAHVKPHGALYHEIARSEAAADAFCRGVTRFSHNLIVVGFPGSCGLLVAAARGFPVALEAFMDRRYEPDGTLRSRGIPGALITEPANALAQALEITQHGQVRTTAGAMIPLAADTLCVHSDTPGAAGLACVVAAGLRAAGIGIRSLGRA